MKQPTTFGMAWNRMLLCQRTLCIRQYVYKETGPWSSGGVLTNRLHCSSTSPIGSVDNHTKPKGPECSSREKRMFIKIACIFQL